MGDERIVAAPFPAPPPFYKHFTKQNATGLRKARREAGITVRSDELGSQEDIDITTLPRELRYLVPPAPPSDGKWRSFGLDFDLNASEPTLDSAGVEQLYPRHPSVKLNPQPHLIALVRSMLTTFLSLTGKLSQDPEFWEDNVQDLRTIVLNMHDLINQYRPHQARETLILMMEERVEKMKAENRAIGEAREKVAKMLQGLQEAAQAQEPPSVTDGEQETGNSEPTVAEKRRKSQRAAWAALDELHTSSRSIATNPDNT